MFNLNIFNFNLPPFNHSAPKLIVRIRRKLLKSKVEKAYYKVKRVCEPETLHPDHPGNPDYMKSDARDYINPLIKKLEKAGLKPPNDCSTDDASLEKWFNYLAKLRKDYY